MVASYPEISIGHIHPVFNGTGPVLESYACASARQLFSVLAWVQLIPCAFYNPTISPPFFWKLA
jgi:hypothetical protein